MYTQMSQIVRSVRRLNKPLDARNSEQLKMVMHVAAAHAVDSLC